MTDEKAMEILDPEHREHYESIEPVEEACRIGIKATKDLLQRIRTDRGNRQGTWIDNED